MRRFDLWFQRMPYDVYRDTFSKKKGCKEQKGIKGAGLKECGGGLKNDTTGAGGPSGVVLAVHTLIFH